MENKLNIDELIEKYQIGELFGDDLIWFENELKTNKDLVNEFNLHQMIDKAIIQEDIFIFRERLENIHKIMILEKSRPIKNIIHNFKLLYFAGAAIILLIIGCFFYFYNNNKIYTNEELFSMYYEPYLTIAGVRSEINDHSYKIYSDAIHKYSQKDYQNAIKLFSRLVEKNNNNTASHLYLGISYMETQKFNKAIESFQYIIEQNDLLYIQQAEWYLALCYLSLNMNEKALLQFEEISKRNNCYKNKVDEILKKYKTVR
ncbi:MAG: tetratricopeptide repeat protein [Bacteroidales bacterium]|nr:tetratricopeptide repeat protein [Bacteroidales bacterium]